jgi:hypothetical protein
VLEFYSDYYVRCLKRVPDQPPADGALLFQNGNQAVFLPPPRVDFPGQLQK